MNEILIPHSLQITLDDVGWFNGADDRPNGGSAHTGISRNHCAEDYAAINELGRRLNMRINCAFIVGEWDPDNRLRPIPYLSRFGDSWDNAAYLDRDEMARCAQVINDSPYIDMAVHGLLHNYYKPGIPYSNSDYYYKLDGVLTMSPEAEVRARLEAFFDMVRCHGIEKKINSFIPPTFAYRWDEISRILKDYGILYCSTIYRNMWADGEKPVIADVENGIITLDRNNNLIPWYEIESDPRELPVVTGIFGCHWPNILHTEPARYEETVEKWVSYFERCADTFGVILSRDIAFAATQSLYKRFAQVSEADGVYTVDIGAVPAAEGLLDSFYVSAKQEITAFTGCEVEETERRGGFINYKVTPREKVLTLR